MMKIIFLIFVIILILSSVCLYYGFNHKWDPETEQEPQITPNAWWQWLLLCVGGIIAILDLVLYTLYMILEIKKFNDTQEKYWLTEEFQIQKAQALKANVDNMKKSELKWYGKMGYLSKDEIRQILNVRKAQKIKNNQ